MRTERNVEYAPRFKCCLTTYEGLADFRNSLEAATKNSRYTKGYYDNARWAGGTREDCLRWAQTGDASYAAKADQWLDKFTNAALETYGVHVEHNLRLGVLDIGAWVSGSPMSVYGPVVEKHEKAPIKIYLDMWIQVNIHTDTIMRRGVAALALVQALSLHRPVSLEIVLANRHNPSRTDSIQRVVAPTAPMDLSRAAWMTAAPVFVRNGLMPMLHEIAQSSAHCGIPALSAGRSWQSTQLGKWLAAQDGLGDNDYVFLPMMTSDGPFGTDESCIAWVKAQVEKHA